MNKYLKELREDTYKIVCIILLFMFIVSGWYAMGLKKQLQECEKDDIETVAKLPNLIPPQESVCLIQNYLIYFWII